MSLGALTRLLEERHGLRCDELALHRLRRALGALEGLPDASLEQRASAVVADPRLTQRLLDGITLQETSFFRDPPVFADLAAHVLPDAIRAARGGPLVVWSAGCANGQEAWALAMLLSELGAPRFEVVASDLSAAAVARARAGVYDERELRGLDAGRRGRFMTHEHGAWRVSDALRRHVRIVQHNAATQAPPLADGTCALVLCRYVLIYLTPEAADALLGAVARALTPDGRLLIGAAESLWHLSERFTPVALPHAVAYRHRDPADSPSLREEPPGRGRQEPRPLPGGGRLRLGAADAARPAARRTAPATNRADTGARTAPSAATPDARGLVRQGEASAAAGDLQAAAAAFRGAAYLDPDDAAALAQLGLVLEALGDPGARRAFRAARAAVDRRAPEAVEADLGGFGAASLVRLLAEKLGERP